MVHLVVALPNPGEKGAPRGLFYNKSTEEGRRQCEEFCRREDRPGWGVFDTAWGLSWREDDDLEAAFNWILENYTIVGE
jgi:hypothetical protein